MTIVEIQRKIDAIDLAAWDYENAHMLEDALRQEFIAFIAQRKDSLGDKARLVLTTKDIDFERYCA